MTKEDKQIIDRAVKENWRIGDRTRLKHLLEKNLKLYRENAELENENRLLGERCNQLLKDKGELTDKIADIKANCDLAIEGRDVKIKELELELTVEKDLHQEETNLHLHAEDYIKSLEQKLEQTEKDLADYQFNYPKIKELEKENAELKKINSETLTQLNLDNGELIIENEKLRKENAGLKAGRLQWHDLRKDPNDLPKEVGNYLVCYIDTMLNRNVFILEFVDFLEDSHWIDETSHEIEKFDEGVIAWCEIPTFDKE